MRTTVCSSGAARSELRLIDTIGGVRIEGTFDVAEFNQTELRAEPVVTTGLPVGVATMVKNFQGQIAGRSTTIFVSAFDPTSGVGTYVALESFEGLLGDRQGTFNFVHSASTTGSETLTGFFLVVPSSGTGELADITGTGSMFIDEQGIHRIWLDCDG